MVSKCLKHKKTKDPQPDDGLEQALSNLATRKTNSISCWMWWIFFLAASPGLLNCWHLTSYVFIAYKQEHWCQVPELFPMGLSTHEVREISATRDSSGKIHKYSCEYYKWNYTLMADMDFKMAKADVDAKLAAGEKPGTKSCKKHYYVGSGVVREWDLVCEREPLRPAIQSAVAVGKMTGAMYMGVIADKYGRKRSYVFSCLLYIASSMGSAFTEDYWIFLLMRLGTGMAGAGTYNCAFTLMTEVCRPEQRTVLGTLYNQFYPLGLLTVSLIAYALSGYHWQVLQLTLSVPTFILLLYCWWIPESPMWLISQRRRDEAWNVVKSATRGKVIPPPPTGTYDDGGGDKKSCWASCRDSSSQLTSLMTNGQMRVRLFLCHFGWFATALTYFSMSLNGEVLGLDRFWYIALLGPVETVSYIVPIFALKVVGRRLFCVVSSFITGSTFLAIMFLPMTPTTYKMVFMLLGGMFISSVYSVIILYTTELFPTDNRNTAVGSSSMVSHFGGSLASFVSDLGYSVHHSAPSTLCGSLTIISGCLIGLLPETKDKVMEDTVEQVMADPKNRVHIRNCWGCNK